MQKIYRQMKGLCFLLAAALMGVSEVHADTPLDVTDTNVVEAFVDGAVIASMKTSHSPSGVVVVFKDGKQVLAKGYGYLDVDKKIPVDPETSMFRPGSISKLFTWVSVMQLVEKGQLDLDVDVNSYLKTFKVQDSWQGQSVTLRHLMTHTAGFEDGAFGFLIVDDAARVKPLAESLAETQPARVNPPGVHAAYSNWGTALAGLIVQNVSEQKFSQYVQEHIFDVLGMTHATFVEPIPQDLAPDLVKAYTYNAGTDHYIEKPVEYITNFGPAGALFASGVDMIKFGQALLGDGAYEGRRILKPETLHQMLERAFTLDERVLGIGLGFIKRNFGADGFASFGHNGATAYFASHFGLSKKEGFIMFSSFSGPGYQVTQRDLVKPFYDEFFPHKVSDIEPPEDFFERGQKYAGTYNSYRSSFTSVESVMRAFSGVKVKPLPDNTLMIGTKRYIEVDKNLFRRVDDYGRVVFLEDKNNQIAGFVYDDLGILEYYKAPFYETASFNGFVLGLSMLVFVFVCLRFCYQWSSYRAMSAPERRAVEASLLVAGLNILTLLIAFWAFKGGLLGIFFQLPFSFKLSIFMGTLATVAAFYQLYRTVLVWRGGYFAGRWSRSRYSFVTVFALLMAWFYVYWNIFGFNYYG